MGGWLARGYLPIRAWWLQGALGRDLMKIPWRGQTCGPVREGWLEKKKKVSWAGVGVGGKEVRHMYVLFDTWQPWDVTCLSLGSDRTVFVWTRHG